MHFHLSVCFFKFASSFSCREHWLRSCAAVYICLPSHHSLHATLSVSVHSTVEFLERQVIVIEALWWLVRRDLAEKRILNIAPSPKGRPLAHRLIVGPTLVLTCNSWAPQIFNLLFFIHHRVNKLLIRLEEYALLHNIHKII